MPKEYRDHARKLNALAAMDAVREHELAAAAEAIKARSDPKQAVPLQSPRSRHRVVGLAEILSSASTCEALLRGKLESQQFAMQLAAMPAPAREQWASAFGTYVSKLGRTVSELRRTHSRLHESAGPSAEFLDRGAREALQKTEALETAYDTLGEGVRADMSGTPAFVEAQLRTLVDHEGAGALRITQKWKRALVSALALARREAAVLEAAMNALAAVSLAQVQTGGAGGHLGRFHSGPGGALGGASGPSGSGPAGPAGGAGSGAGASSGGGCAGSAGGASGGGGGGGTLEAVAAALCEHVRLLVGCEEASLYLVVEASHALPATAKRGGAAHAASPSAPPVLCRLQSTHPTPEERAACDLRVFGCPACAVPAASLAGACLEALGAGPAAGEEGAGASPEGPAEKGLAEATSEANSEGLSRLLLVRDMASDARFSAAADVLPGGASPPEAAVYFNLTDVSGGALRAVLRVACVGGGAAAARLALDRRRRRSNELALVTTSNHRILSRASQRRLLELRPLFALALREPLRAAAAQTSREAARARAMQTLSEGLTKLPTGSVALGVLVSALATLCAESLGAASCTLFLHQDGGKLVGYPAAGQGETFKLRLHTPTSSDADADADAEEEEGGAHDGAPPPADEEFPFGIVGECAKSEQYILLNALSPSDERLHPDIDAVPRGVKGSLSLVCTPLRDASGSHVLGLCELVRAAGVAPFVDDDRPAVLAVLRAVAFAIDNYFLNEMLDEE